MPTQRYSVTPHPVETILTWVKSGEIAIPEIQRPFVWSSVQVRNLMDSLYEGFPVGYLIAWRNPNVRLKDGKTAEGKRILIDGQQRVTALMAALLGHEVITKAYKKVLIRIAFHPKDKSFEVSNPAIQKDVAWIPDIAKAFAPSFSMLNFVKEYCQQNPGSDEDEVFRSIEALRGIVHNLVGIIELDHDLSIETVTEIFIRVNREGTELSQADFAMSKIATNEKYDGSALRKTIDYFCHMAVTPEFHYKIQEFDADFTKTIFFQRMSWLQREKDDIYDPSYTDMLRVAFTSEFKRGKLEDLVALLSGRNFETKQYEEAIAEQSFSLLKQGVMDFMNESHFKRFVMIIRSAGFIDASLIGSQSALDFAYIVYLTLKDQGKPADQIERAVRRWFVLSLLTGRYSGSPESKFDYDIKQIHEQGIDRYAKTVEDGELSDAFWDTLLPQEMNTSASSSPYFRIFQAAQVKSKDRGFLSRDVTVQDLILNKCDVHHIFPKNCLKNSGMNKGRYNQIANYAVTQSEINIAIDDDPPNVYFSDLFAQCNGGEKKYGGIVNDQELRENLASHCIPNGMETRTVSDYEAFLDERRKLMARKLQRYFAGL